MITLVFTCDICKQKREEKKMNGLKFIKNTFDKDYFVIKEPRDQGTHICIPCIDTLKALFKKEK